MKVGILMRDTEYRDALAAMISETGRDVLVEISDGKGAGSMSRDSVLLTDVMPSRIEEAALDKLRKRTVFLSPVPDLGDDTDSRCRIVFKYSDVNTILSELSEVYSDWTGDRGFISPSTRVFAVISESDQLGSERCRNLAAQIIYIHGGSVLIIPLGYINDYRYGSGDDTGSFRRLMYMIDEGRDYSPDCYTFSDSYGISYLRLPGGVNPVTDLGSDYMCRLVRSCGSHFDTVILDIGTCFRRENLELINSADNIVFVGSGRRIGDMSEYIGSENMARVRQICATDPKDEAVETDDYIRELYGQADKTQDH